jgi:hypothetical protein
MSNRKTENLTSARLTLFFANAEQNGKWVALILIPGFGTPGWAMQGVQSGMFTIPDGPGSGMLLPLPVPWDQTYLSRWFTFLKVIADRYAGRASFRKIAAAGPTSVSAEMSLPESPNDIVQWEKFGYTTQKHINARSRRLVPTHLLSPASIFRWRCIEAFRSRTELRELM